MSYYWWLAKPGPGHCHTLYAFRAKAKAAAHARLYSFPREWDAGLHSIDDIRILYPNCIIKLALNGSDPTFDRQTWPEGYTLSRLVTRQPPAIALHILRRHADDTYHWQVPGHGDPVGPFDLESEAIADADESHYIVRRGEAL